MLERLEILVGKSNIEKIKSKKILLIGLGGVGGYTFESLIRSGIENITIVDYDKIDITNLNRQIITNLDNLDKYKTDEAYNRAIKINKNINIKKINEKITLDNFSILDLSNYDYVIDACDSVPVKKEIIRYCLKNNIKFITCMGMGYKMDPSRIKIMDIRKTSYDKLAKSIRNMVKKERLKGKVMCVCSDEEKTIKSDKIGSNSFVPAVAGLYLTSYIINDIVGD